MDFEDYFEPPILRAFDRFRNREKLPATEWTLAEHRKAATVLGDELDGRWTSSRFLFVEDDALFATGWKCHFSDDGVGFSPLSELVHEHHKTVTLINAAALKKKRITEFLSSEQVHELSCYLARLFTFKEEFLNLPTFSDCLADARSMMRYAADNFQNADLLGPIFYEKYNGLSACFPHFRKSFQILRQEGRTYVKGSRYYQHAFLSFDPSLPEESILAIKKRIRGDFRRVRVIKSPGYGRVWLVEVCAYLWDQVQRNNAAIGKKAAKLKRLNVDAAESKKDPVASSRLNAGFKALVKEVIIILGTTSLRDAESAQAITKIIAPRWRGEELAGDWERYAEVNAPKIIDITGQEPSSRTAALL